VIPGTLFEGALENLTGVRRTWFITDENWKEGDHRQGLIGFVYERIDPDSKDIYYQPVSKKGFYPEPKFHPEIPRTGERIIHLPPNHDHRFDLLIGAVKAVTVSTLPTCSVIAFWEECDWDREDVEDLI
jgi:hypothetical protein